MMARRLCDRCAEKIDLRLCSERNTGAHIALATQLLWPWFFFFRVRQWRTLLLEKAEFLVQEDYNLLQATSVDRTRFIGTFYFTINTILK
jgi:hypothetical protein